MYHGREVGVQEVGQLSSGTKVRSGGGAGRGEELEHLIWLPCVAPGLRPRKALPAEEVRRVGAAHDVHDTVTIFGHQAEPTRHTITDVAKPQQAGIVSVQLEGLVE